MGSVPVTLVALYLVAGLLGASVGAVEIFQRYRAEPLAAATNRWGVAYLLFNGAVAALAFHVVLLSGLLTPDADALAGLQWAAAAGFGGAALLRTKLMDIKLSEDREVALGPEIVIQTFLDVIDQELDRMRARVRFNSVRELMTGIDFEKAKVRLPMQIFQAMQGITEDEAAILMDRIADVDEMDGLGTQDKSYILGFYLLDLVGPHFLTELLPRYRDDFLLEGEEGGAGGVGG